MYCTEEQYNTKVQYSAVQYSTVDSVPSDPCYLDLVEEGGNAVLSCSYTLGQSEFVDSVKWFYNRTEIYRIVPGLIDYR